MTQQTPHARALAVAIADLGVYDEFHHWMLDYGNLNHFIAKYLTTLLDSPEMVDMLGTVIRLEFHPSKYPLHLAKAVIAAIKKESGL
jgi:hypothetical protein